MTARRHRNPATKTRARRNKFGAKRTKVDGYTFDSKAEARRYVELRALEQAGAITELRRQVRYPLTAHDVKIGHYVADFVYVRGDVVRGDGTEVVEDVKGIETQLFRWKARHFAAEYGREIEVVHMDRERKATAKRMRKKSPAA